MRVLTTFLVAQGRLPLYAQADGQRSTGKQQPGAQRPRMAWQHFLSRSSAVSSWSLGDSSSIGCDGAAASSAGRPSTYSHEAADAATDRAVPVSGPEPETATQQVQAEAEQVPAAARAETEAVRQRTCQMEKKAAALFEKADRKRAQAALVREQTRRLEAQAKAALAKARRLEAEAAALVRERARRKAEQPEARMLREAVRDMQAQHSSSSRSS